jgi:hypothetical protein
MTSRLRQPRFWLGVLLCVGGVFLVAGYLITPTYLGALLHH